MDVLNNRYRIKEQLFSEDKKALNFLAEDLWGHNFSQFDLSIIHSAAVKTDYITVLKSNFLLIKQVNSPFHFKNYKFERLFSMDGNKLADNSFVYTYDHIENKIPLTDYLKSAPVDSLITIVVLLCKALNYISGWGFGYKALDITDIFIIEENQNITIKIKDIVTSLFENKITMLPPGSLGMQNFEYKPDLLKKLLVSILAKKNTETVSSESLQALKTQYTDKNPTERERQIIDCLFDLCGKLMQKTPVRELYLLHGIIKDINKKLKTAFSIGADDFPDSENYNVILQLEEREDEKKEVISNFYKLQKAVSCDNVFFVAGQEGIGKTGFLAELRFLFLLEKCNVYNIPCLGKFDDESFVMYLLRSLFLMSTVKNTVLFEQGIQESFDFFTQDKNNSAYNKNKDKFTNKIASLLSKGMISGINVFLVDDIHLADDFMLNIFYYLIFDFVKMSKNMFVFSYNRLNITQNKKAEKFIKIMSEETRAKKIQLYNFSEKNISDYIKNYLKIKYIPESLTKKIYSSTAGNPHFAAEMLKDLIDSGDVKKDADTELCFISAKILNPDNADAPENAEPFIKKTLWSLDKKDSFLLNIMSVFKYSFTIESLSKITDFNSDYIHVCTSSFLQKGILKEIVSADEPEYAIARPALQRFLYGKLDERRRRQLHNKIINIMIEDKANYPFEIIWHSEKSGVHDIAVQYCIKREAAIKKSEIPDNYIAIFEQVYAFIPESLVSKKIQVLIFLVQAYFEAGKSGQCGEKIKTAERFIAKRAVNKKLAALLYILKSGVQIAAAKPDNEIREAIKKAETYVFAVKDILVNMQFAFLKIRFAEYSGNIEAAVSDAKKMIARCGDDKQLTDIKIEMLLSLGDNLYRLKQFNDARPVYDAIIMLTENHENQKIRNAAFDKLASIYSGFDRDYQSAIVYYHCILEETGNSLNEEVQISALFNLADLNILTGNYYDAYTACDRAITKIKKIGMYAKLPAAYVLMYQIAVRYEKYQTALLYKGLIKKQFKPLKDGSCKDWFFSFYQTAAAVYAVIGKYSGEAKILNGLLHKIGSRTAKNKIFRTLIFFKLEVNMLLSAETDNIEKLVRYYNELTAKKHAFIAHSIFQELLLGIQSLAVKRPDLNIKKILKHIVSKDISDYSPQVKVCILFFKAQLDPKNEERYLIEASSILVHGQDFKLGIEIKMRLGLFYFNRQERYTALLYFIEAQGLIAELLKEVPDKDKKAFFNMHNYYLPFAVVNDYLHNKLKKNYSLPQKKAGYKKIQTLLESNVKIIFNDNFTFIKGLSAEMLSKTGFKNKTAADIIKDFSDNYLENIKKLGEYAAVNVLAESFDVFITDGDNNIEPLFACNNNRNIQKIYRALKDASGSGSVPDIEVSSPHLIIPLPYTNDFQLKEYVTGYLIFVSSRAITNFGVFSESFFAGIKNIFAFCIENLKMQRETSVDKLTSVMTRKYIESSFSELLEIAKEKNEAFSVLMYDLDHFKHVNDTFGHQIGDLVLKSAAQTASEVLEKAQLMGRIGGEEFLILLPSADEARAFDAAEKIRKKIEALHFENDGLTITVSMGLASFPKHGSTEQELLEKADTALYTAKHNGRNQVCIWQENLQLEVDFTGKFKGVLTADSAKNVKHISGFIALLSLIRRDISKEKRLELCLSKIIDLAGAEKGCFIPVQGNKVPRDFFASYSAEKTGFSLNKGFIKEALSKKSGLCKIDWDNIADKNSIAEITEWNAILAAPVFKNGKIPSLLYLVSSIQKKEFTAEDLNLVNFLLDCIASFF